MASSLTCYLFLAIISMQKKSETLIVSFQKYWWSKNPALFLDMNIFQSVTWNCVYYMDEKILLFTYKLINLSFSIIFYLTMSPRLPKGILSKYIQPKKGNLDATFHWWIFSCKKSLILIDSEIFMIKESYNLIEQEDFNVKFVKQNFPRYQICTARNRQL